MGDASAAIPQTIELQNPFDFFLEFAVHSGDQIWQGIGVAVGSDGLFTKASKAGALYTAGRAEQSVLGDGVLTCRVRSGIFLFANDAGHLLTVANRLGPCYWTDDQTVGSDSTKLLAGIVVDVKTEGAYVLMGPITPASAVAGLLAANNLSDVSSANAARHSIGADKLYLNLLIADLVGTDASVYHVASPVGGTITGIKAIIQGHDLATADAVLTGKIGSTVITTGALTLDYDGTGGHKGEVTSVTPSAANTVVAGSDINFTVSGTQDNTAAQAVLTIEITLPAT